MQISKDGKVLLDDAPLSGNMPDCSNDEAGTVTYQILVRNSAGQSDTRQSAITVTQAQVPTPMPPAIEGSWSITSYRDASGNPVTVVPGSPKPAAVSFLPGGELQVSGGCNTYGGTYTVNGDAITIQVGAGTAISCGPDVDSQESAILAALSSSTRWTVSADASNNMILSDSTGQTINGSRLVATPR